MGQPLKKNLITKKKLNLKKEKEKLNTDFSKLYIDSIYFYYVPISIIKRLY